MSQSLAEARTAAEAEAVSRVETGSGTEVETKPGTSIVFTLLVGIVASVETCRKAGALLTRGCGAEALTRAEAEAGAKAVVGARTGQGQS